jgi:hypothetical protein
MKLILVIIFSSSLLFADSINFDIGSTTTLYNRFSIPKSEDDKISTPTNKSITSYRATGYIDLDSGNQVYLLYAPLEVNYKFESKRAFIFDNKNFNADQETEVIYKFNSYRAGYLWNWKFSRLRFWLGAVGKIRDAKIEVRQSSRRESFDNIGLVPLAALGAELLLFDGLTFFTHTDALGASQGSAYDAQFELKYNHRGYGLSLGKRILGGGADNNKVYTFAQFNTYYLRMSYTF